jgi:phosphoglucomutase
MKTTKQLHDLGQSLWLDNITRELGHSCYDRVDGSAAPAQKDALKKLSAEQIPSTTLAGEPI